jgi:hypothetical protein
MDDELRQRLAALDPDSGVPTDPITSDRARTLLENIMSTPLITPDTATSTTGSTSPARGRRRWLPLGGLATAAVAAVAVASIVSMQSGGSPASALELDLQPSDPLATSCLVYDPASLDIADVAFGGTVTEVTDGSVTVDVDTWFRGADEADVVTITVPEGFSPALDGIEFVAGARYLVTASAGTVLGCGLSGQATPEFEQDFTTIFGA